jgi:hypothetical protein
MQYKLHSEGAPLFSLPYFDGLIMFPEFERDYTAVVCLFKHRNGKVEERIRPPRSSPEPYLNKCEIESKINREKLLNLTDRVKNLLFRIHSR